MSSGKPSLENLARAKQLNAEPPAADQIEKGALIQPKPECQHLQKRADRVLGLDIPTPRYIHPFRVALRNQRNRVARTCRIVHPITVGRGRKPTLFGITPFKPHGLIFSRRVCKCASMIARKLLKRRRPAGLMM